MDNRSVNHMCSPLETADLGIGAATSAGIALSGVAGISQISALRAFVLAEQEQTVFQRVREWYLNAGQKSGNKRRELEVSTCFAPRLRWVLRAAREARHVNYRS